MVELKAGGRLKSAVCATELIAVKAPDGELDIRCGGVPMVIAGTDAPDATPVDGFTDGCALGKRYVNDDASLELLCTKAGEGSVSLGDTIMAIKDAEQLPASD